MRSHATAMKMNLTDITKFETAVSELARNMVEHAGGGTLCIEEIETAEKKGLRVVFEDGGPGIPDLDRAMQNGYTTNNSLGLGLSGAKRLVNDFEITSRPGKGVRIVITQRVY